MDRYLAGYLAKPNAALPLESDEAALVELRRMSPIRLLIFPAPPGNALMIDGGGIQTSPSQA